jgi:hypothetical protein
MKIRLSKNKTKARSVQHTVYFSPKILIDESRD